MMVEVFDYIGGRYIAKRMVMVVLGGGRTCGQNV